MISFIVAVAHDFTAVRRSNSSGSVSYMKAEHMDSVSVWSNRENWTDIGWAALSLWESETINLKFIRLILLTSSYLISQLTRLSITSQFLQTKSHFAIFCAPPFINFSLQFFFFPRVSILSLDFHFSMNMINQFFSLTCLVFSCGINQICC